MTWVQGFASQLHGWRQRGWHGWSLGSTWRACIRTALSASVVGGAMPTRRAVGGQTLMQSSPTGWVSTQAGSQRRTVGVRI